VEQVTPLIRQFTLSPTTGDSLPPFSGGSHIIVILSRGDRTFRNPYSLMGSPCELGHYQIAVRRHDDGRGGSLFLHEQVQVSTRLEISHPVNLFPLATRARKHVFIAGGVGITPILAMIGDVRERQAAWELHYSVRGFGNDPSGPFGLRRLDRNGSPIYIHDSADGTRLDFNQILKQPLGTHVYTCGPPGMIAAVESAAKEIGWPDSHIHSELFSVPPVGRPFDVFLARSGLTVHVPTERSLLEAIEAAGVDAPYLCRGGACGECATEVLELAGELIHNDHWLSDEEKAGGKTIMPCVSRATCTRLVLNR
jgi:ferredoxin-NADP reductase